MRLVMIDNYDSFTYNLVHLFYEFDLEIRVFRHDAGSLEDIAGLRPDWICISPGPKAPALNILPTIFPAKPFWGDNPKFRLGL